MKTTKTTQVAMQWNTMDFPVLNGTPISLYGVVANDANAVGIVMEQINAKTDDALFTIMNGGIVDITELDYTISEDAMDAIPGVQFYQSDKRPFRREAGTGLAYDQSTGTLSLMNGDDELGSVVLEGPPVTITQDGSTLHVNSPLYDTP